jgi:hypothetical protein
MIALTIVGCSGNEPAKAGPISIGDRVQNFTAPSIRGYYIFSWSCNGDVVFTSEQKMPKNCKNSSNYMLTYRNNSTQYNVVIVDEYVVNIKKYNLNSWP